MAEGSGKYIELQNHSDDCVDSAENIMGKVNESEALSKNPSSSDPNQNTKCCTKENALLLFRYLQVYFVTIATILGTGILGLPDTLSKSGFNPFLLTITMSYISQLLSIYLFTELLQKAAVVQLMTVQQCLEGSGENIPLKTLTNNNQSKGIGNQRENAPLLESAQQSSPSLYTLAHLFLPRLAKHAFNIIITLQFVGLLVTYALAGSEAYASVLNISYVVIIPFFTWILSLFIIFVYKLVTPVISLLTLAKGSVLIATVMVTLEVGRSIAVTYRDNFTYIGEPFLLGTVALGGVVNTMPLVFGKIKLVSSQVFWYRTSCMLGLTTCFILNIAWCWSVLRIVPQTDSCGDTRSPALVSSAANDSAKCSSLQRAKAEGLISTVPLTEIIETSYPEYKWVGLLIETFIMVSITVSFLTIGAALQHTMLGCVDDMWHSVGCWYLERSKRRQEQNQPQSPQQQAKQPVTDSSDTDDSGGGRGAGVVTEVPNRTLLSYGKSLLAVLVALTMFGIVFLIAMLNPQGFEIILEKAVSLLINLETGVFFFFMLQFSRSGAFSHVNIPCETAGWLKHSHYLLLVFFTFAVFYDILIMIYKAATGKELPE